MTTVIDAANTLLTGTLAEAETNATAFVNYLTPANIAASASAASLPIAVLQRARDIVGLADLGNDFVRRATIAAQHVTNAS